MKAVIVNRFGDFGLYFAILLIFTYYKTLNFSSLSALSDSFGGLYRLEIFTCTVDLHSIICLFLFVAVIGKSAQLGLHT
jgi:NADH-ubiquinone oxidoreductase chain 5